MIRLINGLIFEQSPTHSVLTVTSGTDKYLAATRTNDIYEAIWWISFRAVINTNLVSSHQFNILIGTVRCIQTRPCPSYRNAQDWSFALSWERIIISGKGCDRSQPIFIYICMHLFVFGFLTQQWSRTIMIALSSSCESWYVHANLVRPTPLDFWRTVWRQSTT